MRKEVKIGLTGVAALMILFFGIKFLKGANLFSSSSTYYIRFSNAKGLSKNSTVFADGYNVGTVSDIIYDYEHPEADVVVILQVDDELKIPTGTRAGLVSGLLGSPSIELYYPAGVTGDFYQKGDTIPSYVDDGVMEALTGQLMPRIQSIIPELDSLLVSLHQSTQNKAIDKSLANIEVITTNLKTTSYGLNKIMDKDVPTLLANANSVMTKFDKIGDNISKIDFNKTVNQLNGTLASIQGVTDRLNNGDGSLGMLLNNKDLYVNLNNTVSSANNLLIDLKAKPSRYVHFSLIGRNKEKKEDKSE